MLNADVDKRITSATAAFGVLKNIFADKYLSEELKGDVYKALILPSLLYGCEAWSLREDLFKRLRSFHDNGGLIYFGSSYKHCQHDLADH